MVVIFVLRNRARAAMEITLRVQERNSLKRKEAIPPNAINL